MHTHRTGTAWLMRRGWLGLALIILGEGLIVARHRPISDFSFPPLWFGFSLYMDAAVEGFSGWSLFANRRRVWLMLFPISAACWWLFELFNQAVNNWIYVGAGRYTGVWYAVIATVDFSTVLPAVVAASLAVLALLGGPDSSHARPPRDVPRLMLAAMLVGGVACVVLPIMAPTYFFGLIWGALFLLLDPLNHALGRPSIAAHVWNRRWPVPLAFALGALLCGFFWEGWNFWALPKWRYNVPYVGFWHIFEMPLLGYLGYLPFGLELFAVANFVLPLFGLPPLDPQRADDPERSRLERAS